MTHAPRRIAALVGAAALASAAAVVRADAPERINVEELGRLPAFSHAVATGDLLFVSGTLGTKPGGLELVSGGAGPETRQALRNIERILAARGAALGDVVKCTVFLADMGDYEAMNAAYLPFFGSAPPARSTLGAAGLALGAAVEIECIASRPDAGGTGAPDVAARPAPPPVAPFGDIPVASGFVTSEGERIYYEVAGEGDDVVVLCHGVSGNHASWFQQLPALVPRYRVVTWDQRGFGRSTNAAGDAGPASAVADLRAVLDHLGVERAHVVGQAMGGWAALGFALWNADRVRSVVLANSYGGLLTPELDRHLDAVLAPGPGAAGTRLGRHPSVAADFADRDPARAVLFQQLAAIGGPPPADIRSRLRATAYPREAVARMDAPILFVVGGEDEIFPPDLVRRASEGLPRAQVVEIPGAGHSAFFEDPAAWNDAVLRFLAGAGASGG